MADIIEKFKARYTIPPSNKVYVTGDYYFDEEEFKAVHPSKHKFVGFTHLGKQFKA